MTIRSRSCSATSTGCRSSTPGSSAGKFPDILTDPKVGEAASNLYADARRMLKQLIAERWLEVRAVVGLFPANAVGDDVEIYADEERGAAAHDAHVPAPAEGQAAGPAARVPRRLHRAEVERRARLLRRIRGHRRRRHRGARRPLRARARRLFEHHAEGARRPLGRGRRGALPRARAARALGLSAPRSRSPTSSSSARSIAASVRRPAIPPVRITRRKRSCGSCSMSSAAPASA